MMDKWIFKPISKIQNNLEFWISSLLLLSIMMITLFFFLTPNTERFIFSLKLLVNNLGYYFQEITNINFNIEGGLKPNDVLEIYGGFDNLKILPVNYKNFFTEVVSFFELFINFGMYKSYFIYLLPIIRKIAQLLLFLIPLFVLIYFALSNYFELHENEAIEESKQLISFKKFCQKIIFPINRFIKNLFKYYKENFYLLFSLILFFWIINFYPVIIDLVGLYFYFVVSFKFVELWNYLITLFYDLGPFLVKVPGIVYWSLAYIIFDKIRIKYAFDKLRHFENYNKGFIKSLGVNTRIHGSPGSGKTLFMTDITISAEELIRSQASNELHLIRVQYPDFPFLALEKEFDKDSMNIKNHYQASKWLNDKLQLFFKNPKPENLFGYDFNKSSTEFNNSLFVEGLDEALDDYIQIYYIYSLNTPLSSSNYAIRHNGILIDNGFQKNWYYEYFDVDPYEIDYSLNSKIINFDGFRISKKINKNDKNIFYDFGVNTWTEGNKERRNQNHTRYLNPNSEEANQLNDGLNDYFSMSRHDSTIRNKLYYIHFLDNQREDDLPSSLKDLYEYNITIFKNNSDWNTTLFMYWIEPMLCNLYLNWFEKADNDYRSNRGLTTLFIYLLRQLAKRIYSYYIKRYNTFNFKPLNLVVDSGIEKVEQKYFLTSKKIFARRYSTNCYSLFFEERYLKSNIGFCDLPNYEFYISSVDEFRKQQSYLINTLDNSYINNYLDNVNHEDDFSY